MKQDNSRYKFRVWDLRFEKFIDPDLCRIKADTGEVAGYKGGGDNVDHWQLEQFTGLKDQNGADIYEGDRIISMDEDKPIELEIHWSDLEARFMVAEKDGGYGFWLTSCSARDIKVIGHIHEIEDKQ